MFDTLDGHGEVVEEFLLLPDVVAALTYNLVARFASIHTLHNLLPPLIIETCLQLIKDHVEELLCILLDGYIDWFALVVLEGETESEWVIIGSIGELQVGEQLLELVDDVIINQSIDTVPSFVSSQNLHLAITGHQDRVPESRCHVELLDHGVHVAYATQVLDADIPVIRFDLVGGLEAQLRGCRDLIQHLLQWSIDEMCVH